MTEKTPMPQTIKRPAQCGQRRQPRFAAHNPRPPLKIASAAQSPTATNIESATSYIARSPARPTDSMSFPKPLTVLQADKASPPNISRKTNSFLFTAHLAPNSLLSHSIANRTWTFRCRM